MTRVAIYDCGTNTTRLLVADVENEAVNVLERHCVITRLGKGVDTQGVLADEAIERVSETLANFRDISLSYQPEYSEILATSAVRDAANKAEFEQRAHEITQCAVRIISGEEEAQLSFLGATLDVSWNEPTLLLDIGGGSTELALGVPGESPSFVTSMQMGAVRLTERYLHNDPPLAEELSQAVSVVRDELEQLGRECPELHEVKHLIGVAGTATTAAAVELGLTEYDSERVHGFVLTKEAAEDVFRTLATESLIDRMKNPGLDPARADVIVGGMVILVSVMRTFGIDACITSERDILDGAAFALATD